MKLVQLLVLTLGLTAAASVAHAQFLTPDGELIRERTSRVSLQEKVVYQQFGYPGVFSTRALFPLNGNHRVGGGFSMLTDLTAVGFDYRFNIIAPRRERFSLHLGSGLSYYSISDRARSTSALGANFAVGTLYRTRSSFALGGDLGMMYTTGDEATDPVRSFGMRRGLSTPYVNFSIGYLF